jgi:hypothetical protein
MGFSFEVVVFVPSKATIRKGKKRVTHQTVFGIGQLPRTSWKTSSASHFEQLLFSFRLLNRTPISIPRVVLREPTDCPLDWPIGPFLTHRFPSHPISFPVVPYLVLWQRNVRTIPELGVTPSAIPSLHLPAYISNFNR